MPDYQFPESRIRILGQWEGTPAPSARERVLAQAFVLFYVQGIRAVGIDLLIARSGVAKASFYRNFPSKVELIVAYVDRRHQAWLAWLTEDVEARAEPPRERLLAIFDSLAVLFSDPDFRGCPVINAVAEVGADAPSVIHEALMCKASARRYVAGLAEAAGLPHPDDVAGQWELLIDGAFVAAQRTRAAAPAQAARRTAELVLQAMGDGRRRRASRPTRR
ncbi:MAG TPA: TetR/AcrR family transcriptional regulator [Acidimicrobiales bacterium]|nr:TetR/AcrR family transcriptional regulator [Acidimicrobiales bacterium]